MSLLCKFFELDIERDFESILNWDFCDLDAEGNDRNRVKLNFEEGQSEEPFSSDLFILLEGNYFLEIVNQAQNVKTICRVSGNHGTKTLQNQSVLLRNNNIAVAIIGDTDHRHSAEVVELLRPYTELAKNVVTLSTKSMVDYRPNAGEIQQDIRNDKVFIKGINSKFSHIKELQAPNMINGVAAGIASWRAFKEQAVESYVIFVRQIHIDGDSAKKVLKLLQDIGAGDTFDYAPKRRQPSSLFL